MSAMCVHTALECAHKKLTKNCTFSSFRIHSDNGGMQDQFLWFSFDCVVRV